MGTVGTPTVAVVSDAAPGTSFVAAEADMAPCLRFGSDSAALSITPAVALSLGFEEGADNAHDLWPSCRFWYASDDHSGMPEC